MKYICLYFQVHQPFRFRNYPFFDIGNDHYYYDDYLNESILRRVAQKCYLPAGKLMLKLIHKWVNKFRISFSISGSALDQFELDAPEVIDIFKELAATGHVEFLAETYPHSMVSQQNMALFRTQVQEHAQRIEALFGQKPKVFRNTELIYSDSIGAEVYKMGFKGMLTEGAKHVLGWKSPNFVYYNAIQPKLKLLMRNYKLSDDIAFRFSDKNWDKFPLTADKFTDWLNELNPREELVNLFLDYETLGEHQWAETGIFDFMEHLPEIVFQKTDFTFETPSNIIKKLQPVAVANVPYPISWADEERDLTAWLGNSMQQEAFNKLYKLSDKIEKINDLELIQDWNYLQNSDHFYYMSTKWFSDGSVHSYFNPYHNPYEAFINYMNILSDFNLRLNLLLPDEKQNPEFKHLFTIIQKKDREILRLKEKLQKKKHKIAD